MNRFKVTHPWKATDNTLLMVYDTCPVTKIFTFKLPGGCDLKNYLYLFNWCIITLQLCRSSRNSLWRVDVIEPCLTCELPAVSGLRRPHAGHSPLVICVRDRGEHWPPMSLGHLAPRHRVTSTGARGQTERGLEVQKKTCAFRGCSVFCGPFSFLITILLTLTLKRKTLHWFQISEMFIIGFKVVKLYKF